MNYGEFLAGKRVVLVGPADYLVGEGRGGWIDEHDIVVRLNWGVPVPEAHYADYGRRTDVLYKRLLKLGHADKIDIDEWKAAGLQWIVAVARATSPDAEIVRKRLTGHFPFLLDWDTRQQLRAAMQTSPLIGMIAIQHLIRHGLASLDIVGCDFYATGYHSGYGGRAYRESMDRKEGVPGRRHGIDEHLNYLRTLTRRDARVQPDPTLSRLLATPPSERPPVREQVEPRRQRRPAEIPVLGVIPARYASSRLPGKPLIELAGKPMILWTVEAARRALDWVVVATDDERIAEVVKGAGYQAMMTRTDHPTGTDRVAEVATMMAARVYVNIQGDEPLVSPEDIERIADAGQRVRGVVFGISRLPTGARSTSIVKAAIGRQGRLVYASRAPVPARKDGQVVGPHWAHRGLYAFTGRDLQKFAAGPRGGLEEIEDVEILRFLEMGVPVHAVALSGPAAAVDTPEDVATVEAMLRA